MTNLDSIFKSRDITLPTKVHLVKAMVFPVVMYGCESWTVKKAEHQTINAFELWCWRRLLRPEKVRRFYTQITEWRGGDKSQHWRPPNTSSPELLGSGKNTKRRPNRVCASEDYPSA